MKPITHPLSQHLQCSREKSLICFLFWIASRRREYLTSSEGLIDRAEVWHLASKWPALKGQHIPDLSMGKMSPSWSHLVPLLPSLHLSCSAGLDLFLMLPLHTTPTTSAFSPWKPDLCQGDKAWLSAVSQLNDCWSVEVSVQGTVLSWSGYLSLHYSCCTSVAQVWGVLGRFSINKPVGGTGELWLLIVGREPADHV